MVLQPVMLTGNWRHEQKCVMCPQLIVGLTFPPPVLEPPLSVRVRSVTVGGCMLVLMSVHISVPVNSDRVLLLCMFQVIPA